MRILEKKKRKKIIFIIVIAFVLAVIANEAVCIYYMSRLWPEPKRTPKRERREALLEARTDSATARWVRLRREFCESGIAGYPDFVGIEEYRKDYINFVVERSPGYTKARVRRDVSRLRKAERDVYKALTAEQKYKGELRDGADVFLCRPKYVRIKYNVNGYGGFSSMPSVLDKFDYDFERRNDSFCYAQRYIFEYDMLHMTWFGWILEKIYLVVIGGVILFCIGGSVLCEMFGGVFNIFGKLPK